MKFCKYCEFWLYTYESSGEKFGTCDHPLVEGKVVLEKEYDGEIVIHTESRFGCIYHSPLHGNVVTKLPDL
jgi:hypothetical protein